MKKWELTISHVVEKTIVVIADDLEEAEYWWRNGKGVELHAVTYHPRIVKIVECVDSKNKGD